MYKAGSSPFLKTNLKQKIMNEFFIVLAVIIYLYSTYYYLKELILEYRSFEGRKKNLDYFLYTVFGAFSFIPVFNTTVALRLFNSKKREKRYAAKKERNKVY